MHSLPKNTKIINKVVSEWELTVCKNYSRNIKNYDNMYYLKEYEYIFNNFEYFKNLTFKKIIKIGSIIKTFYNDDGFFAFNILIKLNGNMSSSINKIIYDNILIYNEDKFYNEYYIYKLIQDTKGYASFLKKKFSTKIFDLMFLIYKLNLLNILQKKTSGKKYDVYFCKNGIWTKHFNYRLMFDNIKKFFDDEIMRLNINDKNIYKNLHLIKINRIINYLQNNALFPIVDKFDENYIFSFNNLHYNFHKKKVYHNQNSNTIITTTNYDWENVSVEVINRLLYYLSNIIENIDTMLLMFKNIITCDITNKEWKLYVFTGSLPEIYIFSKLIIKTFGNYLELLDSNNLLSEEIFNNLKEWKDIKNNNCYYKKLILMFGNNIEKPVNINIIDRFINNSHYHDIKNIAKTVIIISDNLTFNAELTKKNYDKINFIHFTPYHDDDIYSNLVLDDDYPDKYKLALIAIIFDYINNYCEK
ncbi:hypothetical protein Hokovirus_1_196 [Hokovirus HKV1]|uniref:Uncharacterized protein n=1 Tax=Hokovirus HKV1 TaxID=1977638 RepID=A0A1V0SF18_9VIRU|nr:hypothetical protein Hokovirus_1_196 [Hokovirus HKV1]